MQTTVKNCENGSRSGAGAATFEADAVWERWLDERDLRARDELVGRYAGLVAALACRLARRTSFELGDDLCGFGMLGLLDALQKFEPQYGCRFETYAATRIEGAMRDGLRTMDHLPRRSRGRSEPKIKRVVPVDFQTAVSAHGLPLRDSMADEHQTSAIELLELRAEREEIRIALRSLPATERAVLTAYYYDARYLREIGDQLGVTESRVCQLHRRGLRLLRQSLLSLQTAS